MARIKQGSGSGEGQAATPTPRTRTRKAPTSATVESADPSATPEVLGSFPTPVDEGDENFDVDDEESDEPASITAPAVDEWQHMPEYARPGVKAADASPAPRATPASLKGRQSFAGKYVALARLNREDGTAVAPHTEVHLDDAEARYFLAHKVIRSVGVRTEQRGVRNLPAGQDFGGRYRALARLKHDDDSLSTKPGEIVVLTDAQARHYLACGVVESEAGYSL